MGCSETEMQIEKLKESIRNGEMTIEELKDRLHLIIETELLKDDEEVDIELVKACESFFAHLHGIENPLSEEEDKKLWAKIQDGVKTNRAKKRTVRKVPVYAAIAVAAIIILFFGISIRFQWFLPSSTPDGQRYLVIGRQIAIDTISKAIASHNSSTTCNTDQLEKMQDFLGFSIEDIIPNIEGWKKENYQASIFSKAIFLKIRYRSVQNNDEILNYTIRWITDLNDFNYILEQNEEGQIMMINGKNVYRSMNINDVSYTWFSGSTFYSLFGQLADDVINRFLEE